ncbi:MAG: hypothetical protein CL583_07540 [Alteromonadaceae bacterium]|uniref:hypothetical protein n=1 Tax=Marinobacter shengliensis TaxID=1389223 RepID=UPI000C08FB36|nr:hypothetical protein [Marinobacter shengliensis]MAL98291.1 hypothetical protein [Alteromonadaceae bacterium]BEH15242.1 hypothetical protein MAALD49_26100 [Marinobacter shengliensis]
MKKHLMIVCALAVTPLQASDTKDSSDGLQGLAFDAHNERKVQKIMRQQAEAGSVGAELTEAVVVKTHKRLVDSFEQPIPVRIRESTRDD